MMRRWARGGWVLLLATVGAIWLATEAQEQSYEEQLLGVQVRLEFGAEAARIAAEPAPVQALRLDYAGDPELSLQARLALVRYPALAQRLLPLYGGEPEFQGVLRRFGAGALPVIGYFLDNPIASLEGLRVARQGYAWLLDQSRHWLGTGAGEPAASTPDRPLAPEERGWYAIHFLEAEGYDFLGQFQVDPDGRAHWNQTDRALKAVNALVLGGVRVLEERWSQGAEVQPWDLARAALDLAVIGGSVKLVQSLRSLKLTAKTTQLAARANRVGLAAARLMANGGRLALVVAKWGTVPTAVYLMFRYPELINGTLTLAAEWSGLDPWLVRTLFWTLLLALLIRLGLALLGPLAALSRGVAWGFGRLARWTRLEPSPSV